MKASEWAAEIISGNCGIPQEQILEFIFAHQTTDREIAGDYYDFDMVKHIAEENPLLKGRSLGGLEVDHIIQWLDEDEDVWGTLMGVIEGRIHRMLREVICHKCGKENTSGKGTAEFCSACAEAAIKQTVAQP
jgi:hypothetical protein